MHPVIDTAVHGGGQVSSGEVEEVDEVAKLLNNAPATATIPSTGSYIQLLLINIGLQQTN